jgi:hypothetical protein
MTVVVEAMLTTTDNPHDPFTEWREWYAFDQFMGHHTPELLARITITSHDLSEADQRLAIERAIDEIVSENVSGVHVKVTREVEEDDAAASFDSLEEES